MAILRCKMCGGDIELAADKTFGTCECCGNTMTFPKVDDDQRAAAFNRGNHFRRIGEFDKALAVYERIVRENETDAEAHWCCALCRFGIEYVEDPATFEWVPTCHRASFDSFLEDVDYLAAVENSDGITQRQYRKDAAKIAEVQRGILATSQNAEPYDVFICYKESDTNGDRTRDSLLAQDIYYQLTEQGRKVFFARITLEDVVGTQYEPYIFAALNSAKVMIVVGTKPEHLNAVWVKNEWSRFLAMMKKDRNKLLLPCYRDMDPYDMPEQLSVLQSYDMSKIGFIQDLIRGVAKVLDVTRPVETVKETVTVQQQINQQSMAAPLLRRGNIALEDGDWEKADEFFEEVLNHDPECVDAYIGKALAEQKCESMEQLLKCHIDRTANAKTEKRALAGNAIKPEWIQEQQPHIEEMVKKYEVAGVFTGMDIRKHYNFTNLVFASDVKSRREQLENEQRFWDTNRNLNRAVKFDQENGKRIMEARASVLDVMKQRLDKAMAKDQEMLKRVDLLLVQTVKAMDEKVHERWSNVVTEICKRLAVQMENADLQNLQHIKSELERHAEHPDAKVLLERYPEKLKQLCHWQYEQAKKMMGCGKSAEDFRLAKRKFVEIGDYADSMDMARQCRALEEQHMMKNKSGIFANKLEIETERAQLLQELNSMSKMFGGKKRKQLELRLEQINRMLEE